MTNLPLMNIKHYLVLLFNWSRRFIILYLKWTLMFEIQFVKFFTGTPYGYVIYIFCVTALAGMPTAGASSFQLCCAWLAILVLSSTTGLVVLINISPIRRQLDAILPPDYIRTHMGNPGWRNLIAASAGTFSIMGIEAASKHLELWGKLIESQQLMGQLEDFKQQNPIDPKVDPHGKKAAALVEKVWDQNLAIYDRPTKGVLERSWEQANRSELQKGVFQTIKDVFSPSNPK